MNKPLTEKDFDGYLKQKNIGIRSKVQSAKRLCKTKIERLIGDFLLKKIDQPEFFKELSDVPDRCFKIGDKGGK